MLKQLLHRTKKMTRIISIGELLVDMIGKEDKSLKRNSGFSKRAGGAPANVAVAASRLGADVQMVASVGDDEFGEFLREKLRSEDVSVSEIGRSELRTTVAYVALDEKARPHFIFYRGADEHIESEQLDLEVGKNDIVHVGSLPLTHEGTAERILNFVEHTEASVSFDPNLRDDLMSDDYEKRIRRMVELTDMLTAAEEEVKFFGGLEKVRKHTDEIVLTQGEDGAKLVSKEGEFNADAPDVDVVDTTGAGDALTGAYLAFREQGSRKAMEKAVGAAARSTTSKGAMSSLPERSEIEKVKP